MTSVPNPLPRWHQRYAEDLKRYPKLLAALNFGDPIGAVAREARLSELEVWVLQGWADGRSDRDVARELCRTHRTIQDVAIKARYKVLLWLVRGGVAATRQGR